MKLSFNAVSKDLLDTIKESPKKGTSPYDAPAEVIRIDGDTVWVHISGGVEETPAQRTIDCKVGDKVQIRVGNGTAWLVGNATAPPTDDARANKAYAYAGEASATAELAKDIATDADEEAQRAKGFANSARISAQNASEYASRALGSLSTVQSVAETLTWITQHGTMTLTTDTALDPTHVYFVRDANGDYTVGAYTYSIVTEPNVNDISTYYELSIDESLNNYVGTHLALTNEGLWLLPAGSGTNKVLIATGAGSTYTVAGTYIIGSSGETLARFTSGGMAIATKDRNDIIEIANLGYGSGNAESGTANAPYYTFGVRDSGYSIGNYSVAEGKGNDLYESGVVTHYPLVASGFCSHAEGVGTTASGFGSHAEGTFNTSSNEGSHAEGYITIASGFGSHAEGGGTTASGNFSHAGGRNTEASRYAQTAIGQYNIVDGSGSTTRGNYAVIVGNGTSTTRSNALTVGWNGDVNIASGAKYKINGTNLSASDVGAVPTSRTVNNKPLSSNITLSASDVGALATADVKNYVVGQGQYTGSLGLWTYRKWSDGYQEVWYKGSIQFTTASSVANGWNRATQNVAIPISNMNGISAFDDNSVVIASGSYSGRIFTTGGLKSNGTQFEAQQLSGASMATATIAGWNVYIAGYARS